MNLCSFLHARQNTFNIQLFNFWWKRPSPKHNSTRCDSGHGERPFNKLRAHQTTDPLTFEYKHTLSNHAREYMALPLMMVIFNGGYRWWLLCWCFTALVEVLTVYYAAWCLSTVLLRMPVFCHLYVCMLLCDCAVLILLFKTSFSCHLHVCMFVCCCVCETNISCLFDCLYVYGCVSVLFT